MLTCLQFYLTIFCPNIGIKAFLPIFHELQVNLQYLPRMFVKINPPKIRLPLQGFQNLQPKIQWQRICFLELVGFQNIWCYYIHLVVCLNLDWHGRTDHLSAIIAKTKIFPFSFQIPLACAEYVLSLRNYFERVIHDESQIGILDHFREEKFC